MGPICFVWLGGIFLTVTPANAAELIRLEFSDSQRVFPAQAAEFLKSSHQSSITSLLAKLRRSEIFIDTVPKKRAQLR
jgi:hypothetical protein